MNFHFSVITDLPYGKHVRLCKCSQKLLASGDFENISIVFLFTCPSPLEMFGMGLFYCWYGITFILISQESICFPRHYHKNNNREINTKITNVIFVYINEFMFLRDSINSFIQRLYRFNIVKIGKISQTRAVCHHLISL